MNSLGSQIKAAREERGWDQKTLAQRLGGLVGQQAISGWERGTSRPKQQMVIRLAEVLELEPETLLQTSGYITQEQAIELPVRPLSTTLPLKALSWEQFEQFSADLVTFQYEGQKAKVHRYGGSGHKQHGIDILVHEGQTNIITFQCKNTGNFGPADIKKAINDVEVEANNHVLLLTRVATPGARNEVKSHPGWDIWDVEDISRKVRELPKDSALRLVDTYFPGWREALLGISLPGPWLNQDDFFRQFSGDKIFGYSWRLVGQDKALNDVRGFLGGEKRVGVVVGKGGSGKTRVLREVAEIAEQNLGYSVRFLATDKDAKPDSFELLPTKQKLLVILDDVHERTDVADIIAGIYRTCPNAKVILALRPYGQAQLAESLRRIGLHRTDFPTWELEDLKISEAEELAREILGPKANEAIVRRLGSLTRDCPLITVIGAGLIKRGEIQAEQFEVAKSIKFDILRAFRDSLVVGSSKEKSRVLNAISAVQPVHIKDKAFQQAIEKMTGLPLNELMPDVRSFEDAGVIIRRGQSLRIVPDLLGDVILAQACFDEKSGESLGYLESLQSKLNGQPLQHVLVNAARVDWQVRQDSDSDSSLLDAFWPSLEAEFHSAGILGRQGIAELCQKVAYFLPDKAIALVKWAIANPTDAIEDSDNILVKISQPNYQDVLKKLPPILRNVAYNVDHFSEAVNLLWELAKKDGRPPNQQPDHPIRVLQDLASYQIGKSVEFNNLMIDAAQRWLSDKRLDSYRYSPFDVLDGLLATEGSDDISEGLTISFRPYPVNNQAVKSLRDRVNALAFEQVKRGNIRQASRAVKTIGAGLDYPHGLFGRAVTEEERDIWTPLFVKIITDLQKIVSDKSLDPVISVAILGVLNWHSHYSPTPTKVASQSLLKAIPKTIEYEAALALYDGWGRQFDRVQDFQEMERRKEAWFKEIATKVITGHPDEAVVDLVERRLGKQLQLFDDGGHPGPFIWVLVEARPTIGKIICQRVIANPTSPLSVVLSVALSRLVEAFPEDALNIAQNLINSDDIRVTRAVAQAFSWNRGLRSQLIAGELDMLGELAGHTDEAVRTLVLRAVHLLAKDRPGEAAELLTKVKFSDSANVAEEFFATFGTPGYLKWDILPANKAKEVWDQLLACPSINEYHITEFLAETSSKNPYELLNLLKRRVEYAEKLASSDSYHALPYRWSHTLNFRDYPQHTQLLKEIRDWVAKKPSTWQRLKYGAEIFVAVAGQFDDSVIGVLDEAIQLGSKDQLEAVIAILREAPRSFVWDKVEFVKRILGHASKYGEKTLHSVESALYASVISGVRSGTPGQPFSEDVQQRDRSADIAQTLAPGTIEAKFYKSLEKSAANSIRWHFERDEKLMDNRDW